VESEDLLRAQGAEGHGVAQALYVSRKGIIVSTAHGMGSVTVGGGVCYRGGRCLSPFQSAESVTDTTVAVSGVGD